MILMPNLLAIPNILYVPFYNDMANLFRRANLAISRAGAGTLTELAITRTPSILIPYPFAAEDHQSFNAAIFGAAGAAKVHKQSELTRDLLTEQVLQIMKTSVGSPVQSTHRLSQMAQAAEGLAIADSAQRLANLVTELLEQK